jgi:hypothetical protein
MRAHFDSSSSGQNRKEVCMTSRTVVSCAALTVAMATGGGSAAPSAVGPNAPIEGVWRTVAVVVPGGPVSGSRTLKPGATLAIFHGRHYSRVEVHADQPRSPLVNPTTASADEIRAVWGPFVGEPGMFEQSGNNTITMQATVAKNPADMRADATSVYTYRSEGNVLTLAQIRTPAGPSPNPITVTLRRVE